MGERSGSSVRVLRVLEALGGSFVRILRVRFREPKVPGGSAKEFPHACEGRGGKGGEGGEGAEQLDLS